MRITWAVLFVLLTLSLRVGAFLSRFQCRSNALAVRATARSRSLTFPSSHQWRRQTTQQRVSLMAIKATNDDDDDDLFGDDDDSDSAPPVMPTTPSTPLSSPKSSKAEFEAADLFGDSNDNDEDADWDEGDEELTPEEIEEIMRQAYNPVTDGPFDPFNQAEAEAVEDEILPGLHRFDPETNIAWRIGSLTNEQAREYKKRQKKRLQELAPTDPEAAELLEEMENEEKDLRSDEEKLFDENPFAGDVVMREGDEEIQGIGGESDMPDDLPIVIVLYSFHKRFNDQNIDATIKDHEEYVKGFPRWRNSEFLELPGKRGVSILFVGNNEQDLQDTKASIQEFVKDDPLVESNTVQAWTMIQMNPMPSPDELPNPDTDNVEDLIVFPDE